MMEVILVQNPKEYREFKKFRKNLYHNDPYYVSTTEFTFSMLLNKETDFAKSCDIKPVIVKDDNLILCEAILIHNPKDDFVQVAFFEALPMQDEAVSMFKEYIRQYTLCKNLKKVVVGLYGHLSYGVGLTCSINKPNTFDSTYTKPYYIDYFSDGNQLNLYAFKANINEVKKNLSFRESEIAIRPINLKDFENEMEKFRIICNETIGKTYLYAEAETNHFYQLMSSMKFFLEPKNILFAYHQNEVVGFIFWHPDYNEILAKGRNNSLLEIAIRYIFGKHKIKSLKLNSIGVKDGYYGNVTMLLLKEASKYMDKYQTIETNFVWENNRKSMAINKHLLKNIEREFKVVEYNYD